MAKFKVNICYRTVSVQTTEVEVEAEDEIEAEDFASDKVYEDNLFWGKEEVIDGDYIYEVVPVEENEDDDLS